MTKLRGGVFGCGMISEFHLRGWQRIPEVEIVALGNRTISRAEARRDQFFPEARVHGAVRCVGAGVRITEVCEHAIAHVLGDVSPEALDHLRTETTVFGPVQNRGWRVTLAGTGINLALGVLYAWSVFKGPIQKDFGWDASRLNDPYALCCLVFAFSMILAGRCQDKFGPRITAFFGGLLVGLGFFIASRSTNYWCWVIGFGLLTGLGIGFGYSSATPPALKWFPPSRTGLIAGLVVAGFGLASVYIAPLSKYLLKAYGVL